MKSTHFGLSIPAITYAPPFLLPFHADLHIASRLDTPRQCSRSSLMEFRSASKSPQYPSSPRSRSRCRTTNSGSRSATTPTWKSWAIREFERIGNYPSPVRSRFSSQEKNLIRMGAGPILRPFGLSLEIEDHDQHHRYGRSGKNYSKGTFPLFFLSQLEFR